MVAEADDATIVIVIGPLGGIAAPPSWETGDLRIGLHPDDFVAAGRLGTAVTLRRRSGGGGGRPPFRLVPLGFVPPRRRFAMPALCRRLPPLPRFALYAAAAAAG